MDEITDKIMEKFTFLKQKIVRGCKISSILYKLKPGQVDSLFIVGGQKIFKINVIAIS